MIMKNVYVVYTQDGPEHPHMHSVHATKELAEIARLVIIQRDKAYREENGEVYSEEYIMEYEVFIKQEPLICSYGDLGKIFHQSYVWDGPMEGE